MDAPLAVLTFRLSSAFKTWMNPPKARCSLCAARETHLPSTRLPGLKVFHVRGPQPVVLATGPKSSSEQPESQPNLAGISPAILSRTKSLSRPAQMSPGLAQKSFAPKIRSLAPQAVVQVSRVRCLLSRLASTLAFSLFPRSARQD
jgi:hypothetical protein